jgi:hypothetical protein
MLSMKLRPTLPPFNYLYFFVWAPKGIWIHKVKDVIVHEVPLRSITGLTSSIHIYLKKTLSYKNFELLLMFTGYHSLIKRNVPQKRAKKKRDNSNTDNLQGMHPVVLIYTKCFLFVTTQQLQILSFIRFVMNICKHSVNKFFSMF